MERNEILAKLGIERLSEMQEAVCQAVSEQRDDLIVLSPTGTGKTLAYLLPLVQWLDVASDRVQAVVVVPGRELALQSATVLARIGGGVRCQACYGGRAAMDEHRQLRQVRPHVVFATPGRLNDHLDKGNLDVSQAAFVVIDEFDKCLQMGFADEMTRVMERMPRGARRLLLSATRAEEIPRFMDLHASRELDYLERNRQVAGRVTTYTVRSPQKDKLETLSLLLRQLGDASSIVFLNYRDSVERTSAFLAAQGFVVSAFHGGLDQREREAALYRFANGSANVLVSTDLGSRGLDIPEVENIIHYHLPETEEAYVHRVGRTARWEATGNAFFLLSPEESLPAYVDEETEERPLQEVPAMLPVPRMVTLYIGKGKRDKLSKGDIVGFLCKKGGLQSAEIGRIDVKERYTYVAIARKRLRQVLMQTRGEKIKGVRTVIEEVS